HSHSLTARAPPTPPHFPYTTLFRSHRPRSLHCPPARACDGRDARLPAGRRRWRLFRAAPAGHGPTGRRFLTSAPSVGDVRFGDEDRKSTRLNSSHLGTSYAVFCLKK